MLVFLDDRKDYIYFSFTLVYALAINMSTALQEPLAESIQSDMSFKMCKQIQQTNKMVFCQMDGPFCQPLNKNPSNIFQIKV